MMVHPRVAAVLTSLLLTNLGLAQDPLVGQAQKRLATVEAALATLRAGDPAGAQKLLADLEWARKRLQAVVKKDTAEWRATEQRLGKANAQVQALLAGKPPAGQGETPSPTGGLDAKQLERLQQLAKEVDNGFRNLQLLNKSLLGDSFRRNSAQREIAGLRARLAEFPAADAAVGKVKVQLDAFETLFTTWVAEYQADAESAAILGGAA